MKLSRLLLLLLISLSFASHGAAKTKEQLDYLLQLPDEYVLGDQKAKVIFIEYSSLSCPTCAAFHNTIYHEIKKRYIDQGKMKYIYRNYPLDEVAIKAAVLPICGDKEKYFLFIQALFATQNSWATTSSYISILEDISVLGGLSKNQFMKCLQDKNIENQILQSRLIGHNILQINSTPTLIINGEKITGVPNKEALFQIIDNKLNICTKKIN